MKPKCTHTVVTGKIFIVIFIYHLQLNFGEFVQFLSSTYMFNFNVETPSCTRVSTNSNPFRNIPYGCAEICGPESVYRHSSIFKIGRVEERSCARAVQWLTRRRVARSARQPLCSTHHHSKITNAPQS